MKWGWAAAAALVVVAGCGDDGPDEATRQACTQFRDLQADPPDDDMEVVEVMQQILDTDTTRAVRNGARDLAVALEGDATSTEVQAAIQRLDAGCQASGL